MEQFNFINELTLLNITDERRVGLLVEYSKFIYTENSKYNLTGLKTLEEIQQKLIIDSIAPVINLNVPRGTNYADIGTGSGIPGMVIAIVFEHINGVLFDSNNKKTDFLNIFIENNNIKNVKAVNGRLEDICNKDEYRESFDFCFSRAFGPVYYSLEFGLSLLNHNGKLYIYSVLNLSNMVKEELDHCKKLGGAFVNNLTEFDQLGIANCGLLINKINSTPKVFPRRFAVIKRESLKIYK